MAAIKLGDRIRDKISGFSGIAASHTFFLNGCERWLIEPEHLHEGKVLDSVWFDSVQVELVPKTKSVSASALRTGGPQKYDPKR